VITGYNTDVEYGGVTYHVQTEDKGLQTPVILSLVYSGGAILASKRSPYHDLVARGYDKDVLATRLQRQHKLICAAVHAGRIEDLKRLTERESGTAPADAAAPAATNAAASADRTLGSMPEAVAVDPVPEGPELAVRLLGGSDLRGGQAATLRFRVSRAGKDAGPGISVVLRTLGTDFSAQILSATTDEAGVAVVSLMLPNFKSGRAAILVQTEDNGETAELRRIILRSNS
jgi:hypothetical protein